MAGLTDFSVRFNLGDFHYCRPDWKWDSPLFRDYDLALVLGGEAVITVGEQRYETRAGDCFIYQPKMRVRGRHNPDFPFGVAAIHFDFIDEQGRVFYPDEPILFYRKVSESAFLEGLMKRAVNCHNSGNSKVADRWLEMALREVFVQEERLVMTGPRGEHCAQIEKICEEIIRDPAKDYQIAELARQLHVGPDHFYRLFKDFKEIAPQEFIIRCRIEKAKNLLRGSNYNVSEIAEECGYRDIYYFSRQFKNKTGMTPTMFRK